MLIVIRRFCLRTPFLLCQYPCGLFSFTSSPSVQQDMKEYRFNHSAVFSSHKSSKENSTEAGKAESGKLWNLHRQCSHPFQPQKFLLWAIVHTDSTLGNRQAITNLLLVTDRDLHPYFMGATDLHCYIRSPANYCLYVLDLFYIQ